MVPSGCCVILLLRDCVRSPVCYLAAVVLLLEAMHGTCLLVCCCVVLHCLLPRGMHGTWLLVCCCNVLLSRSCAER